ncbi:PQQ-binding-like beta-propeller repeat protein [Gimesia sp.]|uniref:PQQ-binding-like beta-propeller repeat protein n=1 Tax=Gimesia sp. TaxID=2024833 RepID=UPI003A900A96
MSESGLEADPKVDQATTVETPRRKFRWKWGLAILVLGIAVIFFDWIRLAPDRTYQVFAVYKGIRNILLGLFLWWLLFSGLAWKTRFKGLGGAALVFVLFFGLVRVESFEGDMVPRFRFRFAATPEQRAAAYFKQVENKVEGNPKSAKQSLEVVPGDWPGYRGSSRDGIAVTQSIRTDWKTQPPKLLWKHPVGAGWGSFCIVGDRVFTQEQRGDVEVVVCYDGQTGDQLWVYEDEVRFEETLGGVGPRATPTFDQGFLYTVGGTGVLHCFEAATGIEVWTHDLLEEQDFKNLQWGMSGSPLIWEDLVIVNQGLVMDTSELNHRSIIAFDKRTGKQAWTSGSRKPSYSSPQLAELQGVPQVLVFHAKGLESFAPADGQSLWFFPWTNQAGVNAAQPIVIDDSSIFIGSGYGVGSARLSIKKSGDDWQVTEVWTSNSPKLKFNSAVKRDGFVYGLDEGILTCLNLENGNRIWKKGRYGYGQMLLVGSILLILAEDGRVELVKADPEAYSQVAEFQAISGQTWNHPALAHGKLFVRNSEMAACYDISTGSQTTSIEKTDR